MNRVLLEDGSVVMFQSSLQPSAAFEAQGLAALAEETSVSLGQVVTTGAMVLSEAIGKIKNTMKSVCPDQLEVQIGLSLASEGSIIIVSGKATANLSIKAIWKSSQI